MSTESTFKAKWFALMQSLSLRDPAKAMKRFARYYLDETYGLSNAANFDKLFHSYTDEPVGKGSKDILLKNVEEFSNRILADIKAAENAQEGAIHVLRRRFSVLQKSRIDILKNLNEIKTNLEREVQHERDPNILEALKQVNLYLSDMIKTWESAHNSIEHSLGKIITIHKDLEHHGRLRMLTAVSWGFDFENMRNIGFKFQHVKDDEQQQEHVIKEINSHIGMLKTALKKYGRSEKFKSIATKVGEDIKADEKNLLSSLIKLLEDVTTELRFITIILINLLDNEIKTETRFTSLLQETRLPAEDISTISKFLERLRVEIHTTAEREVAEDKQLLAKI